MVTSMKRFLGSIEKNLSIATPSLEPEVANTGLALTFPPHPGIDYGSERSMAFTRS